jgi:hypothetical protein
VTVCFRNFTPSSDFLVPILTASLVGVQKRRENVVCVVVTLRVYCQTCLVLAAALGVDAKGKQSDVDCMVIFFYIQFP